MAARWDRKRPLRLSVSTMLEAATRKATADEIGE